MVVVLVVVTVVAVDTLACRLVVRVDSLHRQLAGLALARHTQHLLAQLLRQPLTSLPTFVAVAPRMVVGVTVITMTMDS